MINNQASVLETYLNGKRAARLACDPRLVPAPGQYLLAGNPSEPDAPAPTLVFRASTSLEGFYAAPPLPVAWTPGTRLQLRGPLGHGFNLHPAARRVALAAFGPTSARLLALLEPALKQKASVVLLDDHPPTGLPLALEILPITSLVETASWADSLFLDLPREKLPAIDLAGLRQRFNGYTLEALIEAPMPCGALGECGVCAIQTPKGWKMACKDGPVFDLKSL
jgi:dihydroorotate dehydrogenase electron transfer subunit